MSRPPLAVCPCGAVFGDVQHLSPKTLEGPWIAAWCQHLCRCPSLRQALGGLWQVDIRYPTLALVPMTVFVGPASLDGNTWLRTARIASVKLPSRARLSDGTSSVQLVHDAHTYDWAAAAMRFASTREIAVGALRRLDQGDVKMQRAFLGLLGSVETALKRAAVLRAVAEGEILSMRTYDDKNT